jgi:energy-coupling factor transporter ATP-binding protein EcfA2
MILTIEIENRGAIRVFKKELNGANLHVAGPTGTGKTTAIDTLFQIMKQRSDQSDYSGVTHGENRSKERVKLKVADSILIARRIIKKDNVEIKITDEDLKPIKRTDFAAMISALAINPHKIMQMKPTERTNTLLSAVELSIDLNDTDKKIRQAEEDRLVKHREIDNCKPGEEPDKVDQISVSELVEGKEHLESTNRERQEALDNIAEYNKKIQGAAISIGKVGLHQVPEQYHDLLAGAHRCHEKVLPIEIPMEDLAEVNRAIADADETNEDAQKYKTWKEKFDELERLQDEHTEIQEDIKELQRVRKEALESAKWPIPGLSIIDGFIYYNDVLLENLGESEQMYVCAALAVKDICKHPIRVVRMDGVESMSPEDFAKLVSLFNKHQVQVLSTRVARDDAEPTEITIVNGEYTD